MNREEEWKEKMTGEGGGGQRGGKEKKDDWDEG